MPDADLRVLVAAIENALSLLPATATASLVTPWNALVGALALGPAPEVRDCPSCGRVVMRAATRCGHCWSKLAPLAA